METEFIYHVAVASDWHRAQGPGEYRISTLGTPLEEVGFIHAGTEAQVAPVANMFYNGMDGLLVLVIDPGRLRSEVRYEHVPGSDAPFPHIYGPLNTDAVVRALPFERGTDGHFHFTDPRE